MLHGAWLLQHDVRQHRGGVCTPPYLLNEPSASTHYLGLGDESQRWKDDPDQGRIRAGFKAIRHVLRQLEHHTGKLPLLAKAYAAERHGIGLRRAAQLPYQEYEHD